MTAVRLAAVAAVLLASAPTTARGQTAVQVGVPVDTEADRRSQEHPTEPQWFMEPTYVTAVFGNARPVDAKGHGVEVHSRNHLTMFPRQNSGIYEEWIQPVDARERARRRNRWTLTLGTTVRGHQGASVPIQTPSIHFASGWQHLAHRRTSTSSKMWMVGAGVGHHSNGQDGCTFENERRVDGECLGVSQGTPRTLNTADGSFGVNYLDFRSAVTSRQLRDGIDVDTALTLGLDYRLHVPWKVIPGGSGLRDIESLYGRHELRAVFQQEWPAPKIWKLDHVQLGLRGWLRFGADSDVATGGSAELAYLGFAGGIAGPFVRLYGGNDYYNIRFLEKRRYVMVGVLWDHGRLARLPKAVKRG